MKLFVANASKQVVNFLYRVPEATSVRAQEIAIGSQIQLSGDLTTEAIDYIIEQHSRYGMVSASEIDRSRDFCGLCYSVDKPVQLAKIERLIHHNTGKLVELGKKIRQESAIASNNMLESGLDQAGGTASPRVNNFEMSIMEENHDDRDEMPAIAEGFRVSRTEGDSAPRMNRRRR